MSTTDRIKKVVDNALKAYQQWLEDKTIEEVSEVMEGAVDSMVMLFDAVEAPQEYRAVERIVERVAPEWEAWKQEVGKHGSLRVYPGRRFHEAMRDLARSWNEVDKPALAPLEPVRVLLDQRVSPRQIALIWGWVLPNGQPDTDKVWEEQANPGKHTSGVDPRIRQKQEERERALAALDELAEARQKAKADSEVQESLEELLQQGISRKQLHKMLEVSDEVIDATAARLGIVPPSDYKPAQAERGKYDKELTAAEATAIDAGVHAKGSPDEEPEESFQYDPATVEAVASLTDSGLSAREVAKQTGLRIGQVKEILEALTAAD